jgi:hypothetical protein
VALPQAPSRKTETAGAGEWMQALYGLVMNEGTSPPGAARGYAYAAVALYEAVTAGHTAYFSLAGRLNAMPATPTPDAALDRPAAASAAMATVIGGRSAPRPHRVGCKRVDSSNRINSRDARPGGCQPDSSPA